MSRRLAVTCWHCVRHLEAAEDGAVRVVLRVPRDPNGPNDANDRYRETRCAATVADRDEDLDLALLRFDEPLPNHLRPVALLPHEGPGDWHTTAWPAQFEGTDGIPLEGRIRKLTTSGAGQGELVLTDTSMGAAAALSAFGASGAPVLILAGGTEVAVGVLRRIKPDPEHPERAVGGLVFAIPASRLIDRWGAQLVVTNPFQQPLHRFDVTDAGTFFGRDDVVRRLRDAIGRPATRVVTLLGASGSGKSSLVRAGLIGLRSPADRWTQHIVVDTYGQPGLRALEAFSQDIRSERGLVVLDQFEQLLYEDAEQVNAFGACLSRLRTREQRLTLIVVVRTDYLALFESRLPGFHRLIAEGLSDIPLDISRADLRAMCEGPAHAAGLTFAPGLVSMIVSGLLEAHPAGIAGAAADRAPATVLPLLGITLWTLAEGLGPTREISEQKYREIGGLTGALADWADTRLESARSAFPPAANGDDVPLPLQQVLLALVRVGEGTPVTREFVERDRLLSLTDPPALAEEAIRSLEREGLVYSGSGEAKNTVALMHDALIIQWPLLARLVERAAPVLRWKRTRFDALFEEASQLRGRRLQDAEQFAADTPEAFSDRQRRYVTDQRRAARREKARRVAIVPIVLVTVALIVGAATVLTERSNMAARNAIQAEANLENAAGRLAGTDPALARTLWLEAYRQRPDDATGRSALAEAAFLAPGLTRTGVGDSGLVVMPDFSQIISPSFGDRCASVEAVRTVSITDDRYCAAADGYLQFAASLGSRMVAGLWETRRVLHLTVWRRDTKRPLWSKSVHRLGGSPTEGLTGLAVADDGTAVVADDHGIQVFDGRTQRHVPVTRAVRALRDARVQISTDGKRVLTVVTRSGRSAASEPTKLISILSRRHQGFALEARWRVATYEEPVLAPDGRRVYVLAASSLRRLDVATEAYKRVLTVPWSLSGGVLSPSGTLLALVDTDGGRVVEFDLTTGGVTTIPVAGVGSGGGPIAVDDNGDLVVETELSSWSFYSARTSRSVSAWFPLDTFGAQPRLSADGQFAAILGTDAASETRLELLDLGRGLVTARSRLHNIVDWRWQPTGRLLVARGDGAVLSFNTDGDRQVIGSVPTRPPFAVDPTGQHALFQHRGDPRSVDVYDLQARKTVRTIRVDVGPARALSFADDGKTALVTGARVAGVISDPTDRGPEVARIPLSKAPIGLTLTTAIALSPDGQAVAAPTGENAITVTRVGSGSQETIHLPSTSISDFALSNDKLAVLGEQGDVTIFALDGSTWLRLRQRPSSDILTSGPEGVRFSPAGDQVVVTFSDGLSLLRLDPAKWAASICAGQPSMSADEYAKYAGVGTFKELC